MKKARIGISLFIAGAVSLAASNTSAAEKFQKLSGSEIRFRLPGMEITDGTHWADQFAAGGSMTSYSMARKQTGKWHVDKDELCIKRANEEGNCYQVWLAGKKIELRRKGSTLPLEGIFQKQTIRG
jgi:hypothetical protein